MPIIATGQKKDLEPIPTGVIQAVCAFVEDIGTQPDTYQGVPNFHHQVVICWELNAKMSKGDNAGKPFVISKFFTLSLNEKANLRRYLESWRGKAFTEQELKGFDLERLKGVNCLLNIVGSKKSDNSETQKIAAIMPLVKGTPLIKVFNKAAPEWVAKKRAQSVEVQEQSGNEDPGDQGAEPPIDDLPF